MPRSKDFKKKRSKIIKAVQEILQALGYNINDQNLRKTPARVAKIFLEELDTEINRSEKILKKLYSITKTDFTSMIVLRNHKTQTRCPHHLERVQMRVSIGYIPNGKLMGLSKLARIADYYCKGLMLQEEVAESIAKGLIDALGAKGVGVYVQAEHGCMKCRGVKTSGDVITTELRGIFQEPSVKQEFLDYIIKGGLNG
jgi:GTP cyclohydrolase IA